MNDLPLLLLGLFGLWIGAELAIRGAVDIAEHYKISHTFLGLTILALGTDLPELFIVVDAAIHRLQDIETSGLIIGETIGTCFSQIGLMLGICALSKKMTTTRKMIFRDGSMMVISVALLFLLSFDGLLSHIDGIVLMSIYLIYLFTVTREEKIHERIMFAPKLHLAWDALSILGGFTLLAICAELTVDHAIALSETFGIPQIIIGTVIVGLGTSIPELATSLTAIRRNSGKMAVGNLIGSNIFDILFALGAGPQSPDL